jgi:GNAT superfamily N-acetyltransferase
MAEERFIKLPDILPLVKNHLRRAFKVEDTDHKNLINFYKTAAWPAQEENKSRTYVVIARNEVVAYLTVSVASFDQIEGEKNTTNFGIQVLMIGKLYVSQEFRGKGIGGHLIRFAIDMSHKLNELTGCSGIIVNSNSKKETLGFYQHYGFKELEKNEDEEYGRTVTMFYKLPVV